MSAEMDTKIIEVHAKSQEIKEVALRVNRVVVNFKTDLEKRQDKVEHQMNRILELMERKM